MIITEETFNQLLQWTLTDYITWYNYDDDTCYQGIIDGFGYIICKYTDMKGIDTITLNIFNENGRSILFERYTEEHSFYASLDNLHTAVEQHHTKAQEAF